MSTFQENLKKYRERLGISAKDFAAQIGVKYSTFSNYENQGREPKYDTLCKIAAALHVSIDDLLGYKKDEWESTKSILDREGYKISHPADSPSHALALSNKDGHTIPIVDERDLIQIVKRARSQTDTIKYSIFPSYLEREFYKLLTKRCIDLEIPPDHPIDNSK